MYYDIEGLCPNLDHPFGGFGFSIKLYEQLATLAKESGLNQEKVEGTISTMGREWLDSCGWNTMFDPDSPGFDPDNPDFDKNKSLGPDAKPLYQPNRELRVSWGEWGIEHITVPGNACGLDINDGPSAPLNGRVLLPHNVDGWRQVQLLLITFCWFASYISLEYECKQLDKRIKRK